MCLIRNGPDDKETFDFGLFRAHLTNSEEDVLKQELYEFSMTHSDGYKIM